jgi:hypothetical protein
MNILLHVATALQKFTLQGVLLGDIEVSTEGRTYSLLLEKKFTTEQALNVQRGCRGKTLFFL